MDQFNQRIYEELLSDSQFIDWVLVDKESGTFGEFWLRNNPSYNREFQKARETTRLMAFKPPKLEKHEISYLWSQTRQRINSVPKISASRKLVIWYGKAAAILLLPLLLFSVWMYLNNDSVRTDLAKVEQYYNDKNITVNAPVGGRLNFELPDGSIVWLNSGSEISYPAFFGEDKREVEISGEAYFKVEKGEVPFVVSNPFLAVKVYGTEFNVKAYDNEDMVVALVEGKVSINHHSKELFMKPGQVSTYNKLTEKLDIKNTTVEQFICWREGKYIFRDTPLSNIISVLQRQYNVSITLASPELADHKYNAIFNGETLDQILELLAMSAPIEYDYERQSLDKNGTYTKARITIRRDKNKIIN